ncbi:hypothetical protein TWF481_001032 [Arthrobotrys musiformis]|uniref:Apple domain-containing protein n=1 Tax=Arthrobotrys musiformis TaxID=47236 RepID=A0AAV9WPM0_9PEZI
MARLSFLYYALFAALTTSSWASGTCKARDPSCPTGTKAIQCSSQISKLKLARITCSTPSTTVIKTVTIKPTTTKTESITSSRTIFITNKSVVTSTVTSTVPVTEKETITTTETVFTHTETTSVSIITIPGSRQEPCSVVEDTNPQGQKVKRKRGNNIGSLDASCSCLLTTTKLCGKSTSTTTITLPTSTKTIKKTVSKTTTTIYFDKSTSTKTITVESTITSTATESVTTTSVTATSTAAETVEEIVEIPYSPCDPIEIISGVSTANTNGLTLVETPSESLADCCRQCFSNKNCALYTRSPYDDGTCSIWYVTPEAWRSGCATESCDWGNSRQEFNRGSNSYGLGRCVSAAEQN